MNGASGVPVLDMSLLISLTSNLGKAKGGSFQKNKKKPIGSGGATLI